MLRFQLAAATIIVVTTTFFAAALAETGMASWYGEESGRYTANGERFRPDRVSCAHRMAPFGTHLRVTDLRTGRSIVCRVNDRGPAAWTGRIVDLSREAASRLGILHRGVARVHVEHVR